MCVTIRSVSVFSWVAAMTLSAWAQTAPPAVSLIRNGPPGNRIDVVYIGDGYTTADLPTLTTHANRAIAYKDSANLAQPYKRYRKFFNYYRVDLPSAESGIDLPDEGISKNTALDGSGTGRLGVANATKTRTAVTAAMGSVRADWINVVLNTTGYYNSGGSICVFAHPFYGEIALHEGGHSFHQLADEYGGPGTYSGGEPREINVTADATGAAKWNHWMGFRQPIVGEIKTYEGGRYFDNGVYRPSQNSKMNTTSQGRPQAFNSPSIEKIILDIYALVKPVDTALATAAPLRDPDSIWVKVIDPEVVKVDWLVDGQLVKANGSGTFKLALNPLAVGSHKVKAHVYDEVVLHANKDNLAPHPLDYVRTNLARLQQDLEWTVEVTRVITSVRAPESRAFLLPPGASGLPFHLSQDGPYRLSIVAADGAVLEVLRGTGRRGTNVLPWTSDLSRSAMPLFLKVE